MSVTGSCDGGHYGVHHRTDLRGQIIESDAGSPGLGPPAVGKTGMVVHSCNSYTWEWRQGHQFKVILSIRNSKAAWSYTKPCLKKEAGGGGMVLGHFVPGPPQPARDPAQVQAPSFSVCLYALSFPCHPVPKFTQSSNVRRPAAWLCTGWDWSRT